MLDIKTKKNSVSLCYKELYAKDLRKKLLLLSVKLCHYLSDVKMFPYSVEYYISVKLITK